jgi:hypothetical protein
METIQKRCKEMFDEVADLSGIEKRQTRTEFMTGLMAGHQHRVSLFITKGRIKGNTERVQGHVHKVDIGVVEKDLLGFTDVSDNHKHRISFKIKEEDKEKDKEKIKPPLCNR